jgi:uncharacterized surface protein with fasciclin (FAS1) repeats
MKSRIVIVSLFITLMSLPMTASAWWWKKDRETLVDVAVATSEATGDFNILLALVVNDNKVFRRLDGWRHTTVFAPTDDALLGLVDYAVTQLCYTGVEGLDGDQGMNPIPSWYIRDVLNYHLAGGILDSNDVFGGAEKVRMLFGGYVFPNVASPTELELVDNAVLAGGPLPTAKILLDGDDAPIANIPADNGIIHAIDRVLVPYLPPSKCE